jgi:hypothetical protein
MKLSRVDGSSGATLWPVIATNRPPSARRAKAERTWRIAASAKRPLTKGEAEKGGFISTTLGRIAASRPYSADGEPGFSGTNLTLGSSGNGILSLPASHASKVSIWPESPEPSYSTVTR